MARVERKRAADNQWLSERREFFVRQAVAGLQEVLAACCEIYDHYLHCYRVQADRRPQVFALLEPEQAPRQRQLYQLLDGLLGSESRKGPLWRLKDLSHQLWPQEATGRLETGGHLLDWYVGSLFHETMKLKETVYLVLRYAPAARRLPDIRRSGDNPWAPFLASGVGAPFLDVDRFLLCLGRDIVRQMEHLGYLVGQLTILLRLMLPELGRHLLVARYLAEEADWFEDIWGDRLPDWFAEIFSSAAQGFMLVGRSYQDGQWYAEALAMYRRALALAPDLGEALVRVRQGEAVLRALETPETGAGG